MPVYRTLVETDERDVPTDGGGRWRAITAGDLGGIADSCQALPDWSELQEVISQAVDTAAALGWHLRVVDRDTREILWDTRTDVVGWSD
jgi:hypothetical protein